MPIFDYKAVNSSGQTRTGIIDADSPKEARAKLRTQELFVTDIQQSKGMGGQKRRLYEIRGLSAPTAPNRRRTEQTAAVTRQLASLLGAGIPLSGACQGANDGTFAFVVRANLRGTPGPDSWGEVHVVPAAP